MADYTWKQGDTEPLEVYLGSSHAATWTLAGTVVFNMKKQGSSTLTVNRGTCVISDATTHLVKFTPTAAQTDVTSGTYVAEFEWTETGTGTVRTFPSGAGEEPDYFVIDIVGDLG